MILTVFWLLGAPMEVAVVLLPNCDSHKLPHLKMRLWGQITLVSSSEIDGRFAPLKRISRRSPSSLAQTLEIPIDRSRSKGRTEFYHPLQGPILNIFHHTTGKSPNITLDNATIDLCNFLDYPRPIQNAFYHCKNTS